jgi:hypothetical protein
MARSSVIFKLRRGRNLKWPYMYMCIFQIIVNNYVAIPAFLCHKSYCCVVCASAHKGFALCVAELKNSCHSRCKL